MSWEIDGFGDGEDDWPDDVVDETMVDLGGGMIVPLRELLDDDDG